MDGQNGYPFRLDPDYSIVVYRKQTPEQSSTPPHARLARLQQALKETVL